MAMYVADERHLDSMFIEFHYVFTSWLFFCCFSYVYLSLGNSILKHYPGKCQQVNGLSELFFRRHRCYPTFKKTNLHDISPITTKYSDPIMVLS